MQKTIFVTKESMSGYGAARAARIVLNDDDAFYPGRVVVRRAADDSFIVAIKGNFCSVTKAEVCSFVAEAMNSNTGAHR